MISIDSLSFRLQWYISVFCNSTMTTLLRYSGWNTVLHLNSKNAPFKFSDCFVNYPSFYLVSDKYYILQLVYSVQHSVIVFNIKWNHLAFLTKILPFVINILGKYNICQKRISEEKLEKNQSVKQRYKKLINRTYKIYLNFKYACNVKQCTDML